MDLSDWDSKPRKLIAVVAATGRRGTLSENDSILFTPGAGPLHMPIPTKGPVKPHFAPENRILSKFTGMTAFAPGIPGTKDIRILQRGICGPYIFSNQ